MPNPVVATSVLATPIRPAVLTPTATLALAIATLSFTPLGSATSVIRLARGTAIRFRH
ncbi:hypothetical protein GCM10009631_06170 [Corynebacterium glaucum]